MQPAAPPATMYMRVIQRVAIERLPFLYCREDQCGVVRPSSRSLLPHVSAHMSDVAMFHIGRAPDDGAHNEAEG